MQDSLFSNEALIQASREFVCIRIETYENKASEQRVRSLLRGRFANTAFCIFDPEGEERLSRAGRSPETLAGRGGDGDVDAIVREMNRIASAYCDEIDTDPALLQDFETFRQALNVASADQRLLLVVTSSHEQMLGNLREVICDDEVIGRFHIDLVGPDSDAGWADSIQGEHAEPGILIVRSGQFGLEGEVMQQLPQGASVDEIKRALRACNTEFASLEDRKDHGEHVAAGRRQGIYFENEIPYGEDRDADGVPDQRESRRDRQRRLRRE